MAAKPASVSALTLAGWLMFPAILTALGAARAQTAPLSAASDLLAFDIPAQPLADALKRYAAQTRQPTLYRSEIVHGRTSAAVHGNYSPEAALRRLLDGSGLSAEKVDSAPGAAFVLKPIAAPDDAPPARLAGYPSLLQARIWDVLCGDPRTAPGDYRVLLRFEVDTAGQVERPRLLGSSGDVRRDAAMLAALQQVRMDGPPPPDLLQPVTLLIMPRQSGSLAGPSCARASEAS